MDPFSFMFTKDSKGTVKGIGAAKMKECRLTFAATEALVGP